ncbi:hypothetical protein [Micromonospora sp. NPDC047730]|uniref:hypothetical protein n=1 Tax=Micromonospora sp. NPDC047730 TaxID=3364253 RepID=UPI003719599C
MPTTQDLMEAAFKRLRDKGITPTLVFDQRAMVRSDCLEAYERAAQVEGNPGRWVGASFTDAQWRSGMLHYRGSLDREWHLVHKLLFSFPRNDLTVPRELLNALAAERLHAEWQCEAASAVEVWLT